MNLKQYFSKKIEDIFREFGYVKQANIKPIFLENHKYDIRVLRGECQLSAQEIIHYKAKDFDLQKRVKEDMVRALSKELIKDTVFQVEKPPLRNFLKIRAKLLVVVPENNEPNKPLF